ncbi:MAG TPA: acyltransferase [Pirellulales bacterium]
MDEPNANSGRGGFRSCGDDVQIGEFVVIKQPQLIELGSHVAIDSFVYISTALQVGSYVHVAPMVTIIGGKDSKLVLEDFSGLSAGCRIVCGSDDFVRGTGLTNPTVPEGYHGRIKCTTIVIERHAIIGTNCVILPGVRIGEGAAVGACSLVKSNLQPWTIYAGVPAVEVGRRRKETILEMEAKLWADVGRPFGADS